MRAGRGKSQLAGQALRVAAIDARRGHFAGGNVGMISRSGHGRCSRGRSLD